MRSVKELLQVMLQHKQLFRTGLCLWATYLKGERIITEEEDEVLHEYIKSNRPDYFSWTNFIEKHPTVRNGYPSLYFFPHGKIKPRIYWIKTHIKRLS